MAKHSDNDEPKFFRGPGVMLLLASSRWRLAADAVFEDCKVSAIQTMILVSTQALHTEDGPANQVDIARFAGLDVMTMSKNVRILESNGLVKRTTNPRDSRARTVELTKDGVSRLKKVEKGLDKADEKAFDELGGIQKMRRTLAAYLESAR